MNNKLVWIVIFSIIVITYIYPKFILGLIIVIGALIFIVKYYEEDENGYDRNGYDSDGYNKAGYDKDGYDKDRYRSSGLNQIGYDRDGYDGDGYNEDGYDRNGYKSNGFNPEGYNKDGLNQVGYDKDGYDKDGYDKDGYDGDGYNEDGYDRNGYKSNGFNPEGYDQDGYNKDGFNQEGDPQFRIITDGYDKDGFGQDGYDRDGYDKNGYDKEGYTLSGFGQDGYDSDGYDRDGHHIDIHMLFDKDEILLDTNILMNPEYDILFEFCVRNNITITLLASVYEEIDKLKRKWNKTKIKDYKNNPYLASNRVVDLDKDDLLVIPGLGVESPNKVYADPELITYLKETKDKSLLLISDDQDVIIRSSQLSKNANNKKVILGKHLLQLFGYQKE